MKKLLFCLILASAIQTLPMEPEETECARYLNNLPVHKLIALEENEIWIEVTGTPHEEKTVQIENYTWYGDTRHINFLLNMRAHRTRKEYILDIDDLCLSIKLANAYEAKVQSYLDSKEAEKEKDVTDKLRVLNPRVYLNPIIETLLLSDNPKNEKAIRAIILNAPKYCYLSPLNVLFTIEKYTSLTHMKSYKFVKFLKEARKPTSVTNVSKFKQKRKLGNVGYLINKFNVPGNVKDQIFSYVLTDFLRENKTEIQSLFFKLSISDLAKLRSNIPSLELPHHLYAQDLDKASYDLGCVIKRLGATYDHENNRHDFETLTAKRAAFDEYIRPIVIELLPNYNLDAPDNNEFNN